MIAVTLDQAKIARLPQGTATLIVGNPMIADVTMLKNNNTMVITGKGFGQTNLIAIDAAGSLIEEEQIQVLPSKTVLVLQSGSSRMSYACNPDLHADGSTRRRRQDLQGRRRTDRRPATVTPRAGERPRIRRTAGEPTRVAFGTTLWGRVRKSGSRSYRMCKKRKILAHWHRRPRPSLGAERAHVSKSQKCDPDHSGVIQITAAGAKS